MTLGQTIGKIKHTFGVTNSRDEKAQITVYFDFSTATDNDIKTWLVSNRVIAMQRPTRSLSLGEINGLNGQTVMAIDCGKKVKSREERISELIAVNVPRALAEMAIDNPEAFNAAMAAASSNVEDKDQ
jgi:hypothetical protein